MNEKELPTPCELQAELFSAVLTWIAERVKVKNVSPEHYPQYLNLMQSILVHHNLISSDQAGNS
jgi:hypothetical protein